MATMIKEEKYMLYLGTEEHVLRVQELVWGLEPWPEKFRALLPESPICKIAAMALERNRVM